MHKHHIIPKHEWKKRFDSLEGVNDADNLVDLSVEQHADAHRILFEEFGRWEDKLAWLSLSNQITSEERQRLLGQEVGKRYGKIYGAINGKRNKGKFSGSKNPMYGTARKEQLNPFYRQHHSEETKSILRHKSKERYKATIHPRIAKWIIIAPTGETFEIQNLTKFCRENGLDQGHLSKVAAGKLNSYKQFKCQKVGKNASN